VEVAQRYAVEHQDLRPEAQLFLEDRAEGLRDAAVEHDVDRLSMFDGVARQSVIARAKAERRWNDGSPRQRNASAISVCPSTTSKASKWPAMAAASASASSLPSRRTGGRSTWRFFLGSSSPGCET